jgi:hypothetical protein
MSSKRLASAVVAGAIVAVGIAAVVDAVVSGDSKGNAESRPASAADTSPRDDPLAAVLAEEEIRGVLYYSDPEDECRVHAVELPSLREVPPPKLRACRFELPPNPEPAWVARGSTWNPRGLLGAACVRDQVEIWRAGGTFVAAREGCAPAWKPDGTLTAIRNGEVWCIRTASNDPCEQTILTSAELQRAARRVPIVPPDPRYLGSVDAMRIAWLGDTRAAVAVRIELRGRAGRLGPLAALAFFERERVLGVRPSALPSELRVSPSRRFLAAREGSPQVSILTRSGRQLGGANAPAGNARAVSWSPDERWTAIATQWSVYLVRTSDLLAQRESRSIRLPITARDLAWR